MTITNNNVPLLHRPEWQMMTPNPSTTGTGNFIVFGNIGAWTYALYVANTTTQYLYNINNDGWMQIPSGALAGTFGAGACGEFVPWSFKFVANGGSTTTIQVAAGTYNIVNAVGATVRFTSGTNIGLERTITDIEHSGGTGNTTLTLSSAVTASVANLDTFKLTTGQFYVMNAGTTAAGIFKRFEVATMAWSGNLSTTNLPATWGTDGRMAHASRLSTSYESFTADTFGATSVGLSTKAWTSSQWINYQVRITGGTGIGQIRQITANNGTTLTVSAWTTTPDATSTCVIEGSDDYIYLAGNNNVAMYRYSISGDSWTALSPSPVRSSAPSTGMSLMNIGTSGSTAWADVTDIKDGRYIYSFRGGGTATLQRYDIAANGWADITYVGAETFTTGASADARRGYIYIQKEGSASIARRFFKYCVVCNRMDGWQTLLYTDGSAAVGNKLWVADLDATGTVQWVYVLGNNSTTLHRCMII